MSPDSKGLVVLLCALGALPTLGIDICLPALGDIGSSLGVGADRAGLTISVFMVGYGVAPPLFGPVSDRIGRKPIVLGAVALFALASLGCAISRSLSPMLVWRFMQGMGAGVATTLTFAIVQDLYPGAAGRAKLSNIASLMMFAPIAAPAAGTAVLAIGGWRSIYGLLVGVSVVLLGSVWLFFGESARLNPSDKFSLAAVLQSYVLVLSSPVTLGYILVGGAGFGALIAYISGSPLFFIDALGVSRSGYSLIYAATFVGLMASLMLNGRLSTWGVAPAYPLATGIALAIVSAAAFLVAVLAGWSSVPGLAGILVVGTLGFGLIAPNAIHGAMQPLPAHAGAVSAVAGLIQVLIQSFTSAAVFLFNGRNPGLSMAIAMTVCAIGSLLAYGGVARRAEAGAALLQR
jgi:MFS transporter, DHA1 family, multidrug resistance protein